MQPNLLNIHHGYNFRDLGGYKSSTGATIASHRLIRSGKLDMLSTRDVNFLTNYGVRYDVDFRSPEERIDAPDRVPAGASYHFLPVFPTDETEVSISWEEEQARFSLDAQGGYQNMLTTYTRMVSLQGSKKAYREFFDLLLANETAGSSLLFHCSAGKDRTGMGAVYLLSALGIDDQTIRADYMAANDYIQEPLQLMLETVRKEGANANLQQSIYDLWTVKSDYLDSALNEIAENYGDMRSYLRNELALNDQQVTDLRRLYLNEAL